MSSVHLSHLHCTADTWPHTVGTFKAPKQFSHGHKEDEIKAAPPEIASERGLSEETSGGKKRGINFDLQSSSPFLSCVWLITLS